ncbi:MAG: Dabb family protein [Pseudomonadota bacterium]|jgi:hypothetical protein
MPVNHIVCFKFKEGTSAHRITEHLASLATLGAHVPGIRRLSLGENFTQRSLGYTHGMVVELEDREALTTYLPHPYHAAISTALRVDAEIFALDYEF